MDKAITKEISESIYEGQFLKEMDGSIEGLVNQCRFWNTQLEALLEQNHHLKLEERSLRKDYEEVLRKTRNNNDILHDLQDSEKKLATESADYCSVGKRLEASYFENVNLSSHCLLLESEKKELVQNLKANNKRLAKINRTHASLQDSLERQQKCTEVNQQRYDRDLNKYRDSLAKDMEILEDVKRAFSSRDSVRDSLRNLVDSGVKAHLNLNTQDSTEEKDVQIPSSKEMLEVENQEVEPTMDEENPNANEDGQKSNEEQTHIQVEEDFASTLIRTRTLFQASMRENAQLQQIYSDLNDRMRQLNDLYIETNELFTMKGSELQTVAEKASDLFRLILQKRKKFAIPQRKLMDELDIKIQNQVQKVDTLKRLIAMFLAFDSEDSKLYRTFTSDVQEIYRSALVESSGKLFNEEGSALEAAETRQENCSAQT